MAALLTFLLTEIVDSTRSWERDDVAMAAATERLDAVVAATARRHGGVLVKPRGEGDAHFLTFEQPAGAVAAAEELVTALLDEPLLAMRAACHTGPAEQRDGDWYGTTVNRCARLRAVAHPRQVLLSVAVAGAVDHRRVRSLGRHRLKDLDEPVEVFQLLGPALPESFPPLPTLLRHHDLDLPLTSFVGRQRELALVLAAVHDGQPVTVVGPPGAGKHRLVIEARRTLWEQDRDGAAITSAPAPSEREEAETVVVPVGPLPAPGARQLFLDRCGDVGDLGAGGSDVDDVVDRLDGLPLALELAAHRARAVPFDRLASRLAADPLAVLGGHRTAQPAHHRSFAEALAHTDALLDDRARAAIRAADGPWWVTAWRGDDGQVLPLLRSLVS